MGTARSLGVKRLLEEKVNQVQPFRLYGTDSRVIKKDFPPLCCDLEPVLKMC